MWYRVTLVAILVAFAAAPSPAAAARPLDTGFMDLSLNVTNDDAELAAGLANAKLAGAKYWRFHLNWRTVSPTPPPSRASGADPNWNGYRWESVDRMVQAIRSAGLEPLPLVLTAPDWAEGPNRPKVDREVPGGTWRPSPGWFGSFASALATRYSGSYRDPSGSGTVSPRVTFWQAWNEPNLSAFLTPQWTRRGGTYRPASPTHYRKMLAAFYNGVKRVDKSSRVVTAGTAPFGDLRDGDPRMPPVRFWREALCIQSARHPTAKRCQIPMKFDILAHHPYPIGPPRRKARNRDDAVVPDLGKITRLLPPARRAGNVIPRTTKPVWVTEISWDSRPDPDGLPLDTHARYMQASFFVLWRQGVANIIWLNLRDQAPDPSYAATYQSGVFLRGDTIAADRQKPALTAFRFPFTAYRESGVATLWGKSPRRGTIEVQARVNSEWRTVSRLTAGANGIFIGRLRIGPRTQLRATAGHHASLVWETF